MRHHGSAGSQRQRPGRRSSPLSAADVAAASATYTAAPLSDGGQIIWWAESLPNEGRTTIMRRTGEGPTEEVLPTRLDARTRVHEYGGRCWALAEDSLITSHFADQRLYRVDDGETTALTPDTGLTDRYAEPIPLPGGEYVLCVRDAWVPERPTRWSRSRWTAPRRSSSCGPDPTSSPRPRSARTAGGWPSSPGTIRRCPGTVHSCASQTWAPVPRSVRHASCWVVQVNRAAAVMGRPRRAACGDRPLRMVESHPRRRRWRRTRDGVGPR